MTRLFLMIVTALVFRPAAAFAPASIYLSCYQNGVQIIEEQGLQEIHLREHHIWGRQKNGRRFDITGLETLACYKLESP